MNRAARACLVFGAGALLMAFALTTRSGSDPGVDVESARPPAMGAPPVVPVNQEGLTTSVTPCRIVDTRGASAGALGASETRDFYATGSSGFPFQGGTSLGCGIPIGASTVIMSVSVVNPTADGFLRAWADGTPEPQATLVNFQGGDSTSVTAPVPVAAGNGRFSVRSSRATHLVVDVVGYTSLQLHAGISAAGSLDGGSSRAVTAGRPSTGRYTVTFNRNLNACTAHATTRANPSAVEGASAYVAGNSVYVTAWRYNGASLVPTNQPVNVTVTC